MISSGNLTRFIDILAPNVEINDMGEQVTTWKPICRTRAAMLSNKGVRTATVGDVWSAMTYTMIMRYRPAVNFRCRVRDVRTGETYVIEHIDDNVKDGSMTLTLSSIDQNDGKE